MRILHLNNLAGVPETLAREQRKRGHKVLVINWNECVWFNGALQVSQFNRLRIVLQDWNIIHCHSCSLFPFNLDKYLSFLTKGKILYHHHGSDIRYTSCRLLKQGVPHLVSTMDLTTKCPNALYLPNPIENNKWRTENAKIQIIQTLPQKNQACFLKSLKQVKKRVFDIPMELFGVNSLSGLQAKSAGLKVIDKMPYPHEVEYVCDLLDYIYNKLI